MPKTLIIEDLIREAIQSCSDESGWAAFAKVGAILKSKGVEYEKLSLFFENYTNLVDLRTDSSKKPPIKYIKNK